MSVLNTGPATAQGIPRAALAAFIRSPLEPATWRAVIVIVLGFGLLGAAFSGLSAIFATGGSLLVMLVGIPIIALGIELCRLFAVVERWRMAFVDGRPRRPHAYRSFDAALRRPLGPWLRQWAEATFVDENRWRDVAYVLVAFPLATIEFVVVVTLWSLAAGLLLAPFVLAALQSAGFHWVTFGQRWVTPFDPTVGAAVALVLGLLLVPVAASVSRGLVILHGAVVDGLLCVSERAELRQRVEHLKDSRSAALEVEASELRRIERDLHDGAQQRLVMMTIDLSLATERIDSDPAAAKELVRDAREHARQALAELRDLVRGTAPAILLDRGLVAALGAIAGRCSIPTVVDGRLAPGQRLPHAAERAAYFVVAEALANVAKHSQAQRCEVVCWIEGDRLVVEVRDDGVGGAVIAEGGGLAGLRDRVEALDGAFMISSQPGGPTILRAELPVTG